MPNGPNVIEMLDHVLRDVAESRERQLTELENEIGKLRTVVEKLVAQELPPRPTLTVIEGGGDA
jgi:hypothetical protein